MIWNLKSAPALASLPRDEVKRLIQEACEAKSVRRASLFGLVLCGLCSGAGALIGDVFSAGIYGSAIGGGVGGFIYSQMRASAILRWIEAQNKGSSQVCT